MTHRFPIKEIARQAALGTATVDRVLNNRANVSQQTRARVRAAIAELEAQEAQLSAQGRRLFFDFVIEAPSRFSHEVKRATEAVLPQIGTAVCRPRFIMQDIVREDDIVAILARILKRGSHGVCIKARDTEKIRAALNRLCEANIPIVTLVTDILNIDRIAYVGLDNEGAGRTAAHLLATCLGTGRGGRAPYSELHGQVLATRSHEDFSGEWARHQAFTDMLARTCPNLQIIDVQGGRGVDFQTSRILSGVMAQITDLRAVYSMGGGNRSILKVLDEHHMRPDLYIAHDLDRDNRALLTQNQLDFVLHHDLEVDIRHAFDAFLSYHHIRRQQPAHIMSRAQIISPENIPFEV